MRRARYLRRTIPKLEQTDTILNVPKQVFVSFNVKTGFAFFNYVKIELEKAGFKVITGFDANDINARDRAVNTNIISKIRNCPLFLGIITHQHDYELSPSGKYPPSAWVFVETGIAAGIESMKSILMIHRNIHSIFWRPIFGHLQQILFDESDYIEATSQVLKYITAEYQRLRDTNL